ncbi:MoxR family ATPase [Poseidonocella sp. HB161398]|uniref:AAA family ATPase n=1 Tax=Poseidonocella sp. HB161398 TaxID=2320855 RepID=UPI00148704FB|nr:MoxR family ATPase [Poseidonocella sp. HB161398]
MKKEDMRQALADALAVMPAKVRRSEVRRLATIRLRKLTSDGDVAMLLAASPLVGEREGQFDIKRRTISALRDYLSEIALASLVIGDEEAWRLMQEAIVDPAEHGVPVPGSKCGYAFGQHKAVMHLDEMRAVLPSPDAAAVEAIQAAAKGRAGSKPRSGEPEGEREREPVARGVRLPPLKDDFDHEGLAASLNTDSLMMAVSLCRRALAEGLAHRVNALDVLRCGIAECETEAGKARLRSGVTMLETMSPADVDALREKASAVAEADGWSMAERHMAAWLHRAVMNEQAEKEEASMATAKTEDTAAIPADKKMMLDLALAGIGMPKLDDIMSDMLKGELAKARSKYTAEAGREIAVLRTERNEERAEVERLRAELDASKLVASATMAAASGHGMEDWPKGKVDLRPAHEVFGLKRAHDTFGFKVPVWTWDNEHPHVPEADEGYIFRPIELLMVLVSLAEGKASWLYGHTGTGKTTLLEQVAARLRWPCFRLNFDSEITRADLIGRDVLRTDPETGQTVSFFEEGVLPMVMQRPFILILDELDFVRSDVAYVMQRALEQAGLVLTEDGGRIINPHPMFRMFATGNTKGQGDDSGLYQGARVQSVALLNRFSYWIGVDYLEAGQRRELMEAAKGKLANGEVLTLANYVTEHMEAFKAAKVVQPISPRDYLSLVGLASTFVQTFPASKRKHAIWQALEATVLNRANDQDRAVLVGIADRCVPKA